MVRQNSILSNYSQLQKELQEHHRTGTLVAVTKYQSVEDTQACIDIGIQDIAESKVQDAITKKLHLQGAYTYHLIGHLQTNKVSQAVSCFDVIQSVDSLKLIHALGKEANKQKRHIVIFLQLNLTQEPQKYGFTSHEIVKAIHSIKDYPYIHLEGCMCMGKAHDIHTTQKVFTQLKEISSSYHLPQCSMGMSQDRQIGVSAGSTMLRIGSLLFEERDT